MTTSKNDCSLPKPNESCCAPAPGTMKRSALLFDRLFILKLSKPLLYELGISLVNLFYLPQPGWTAYAPLEDEYRKHHKLLKDMDYGPLSTLPIEEIEKVKREFDILAPCIKNKTARLYAEFSRINGFDAIPIYDSKKTFETDFAPGKQVAYQAILSSIPIVIENELSWDQVIEFRKDPASVRKYRDLKIWLQDGLKADSVSHAEDIISKKIDDYTWAIEKHGIKTRLGAYTLVSAGLVGIQAAPILDNPIVVILTGGLALFSTMSAYLGMRELDLDGIERGDNSEIAYIYDIKKRFGDKTEQ